MVAKVNINTNFFFIVSIVSEIKRIAFLVTLDQHVPSNRLFSEVLQKNYKGIQLCMYYTERWREHSIWLNTKDEQLA